MPERKKGEHFKYVVVTYKEVSTSDEMTYFDACRLKNKLDEESPHDYHEVEIISVPLREKSVSEMTKEELLNEIKPENIKPMTMDEWNKHPELHNLGVG